VTLANFQPAATAQVFRYSNANLAAIVRAADQPFSGNTLSADYPANSITLMVIPPGNTAPVVISGNAGVAGAVLAYSGGSTTAGGNGAYSISVVPGWDGTVRPSKAGYIFTPDQRSYTNLTSNQTGQDFAAVAGRQIYLPLVIR
jgi:hypothetical protein